ncbi:predicted protein [Chaetoceros tenuissimus]|uniref:Uncharacterized protein n=1 Tax=Chaetoceros tenuissimus TaxID=426638 RepID=A0AAD3HA20_9STRA|nr:predicted protein [Chaetoceros tenuissimus]GFH55940.1 predicted protein [Chaetoceros tenuissimus]
MNFQVSQKRILSIRDLHHSKNYEIQNRRIEDSTRSDLLEHNPFEHVDASLNMRRNTSERDIKRYADSKIAKQTCSKAPKVLKELDERLDELLKKICRIEAEEDDDSKKI